MKIKKLFFFVLPILIISSCSSRIEQTAIEYFELINNKDFNAVSKMTQSEFGKQLEEISEHLYNEYETLSNYELLDNTEKQEDGFITTTLIYMLDSKKLNDKVYIRLDFRQESSGDVPNISGIYFNENRDYIENMEKNMQMADELVEKFYEIRKIKDGKNLALLLDKGSTEGETEKFINILSEVENYYGKVTDHFNYYSYPYINNNNSMIVKRTECNTSDNKTYYEEITMVKRGDDFKISDFAVRQNKNEFE